MALQGYFWFHIRKKEIDQAEEIYKKYKAYYPDSQNLQRFEPFLFAGRDNRTKALQYKLGAHDTMVLHCFMGMNETALTELISYYGQNYLSKNMSAYFHLKTNAFYQNIRPDPRFQNLLAKHKVMYESNLHKYGDLTFLE